MRCNRWGEGVQWPGTEYKIGNCCWVPTNDLSRLSDMQYKNLTCHKQVDSIKFSPPRPWTPRPASVSFLLVEEQQQKQQVRYMHLVASFSPTPQKWRFKQSQLKAAKTAHITRLTRPSAHDHMTKYTNVPTTSSLQFKKYPIKYSFRWQLWCQDWSQR